MLESVVGAVMLDIVPGSSSGSERKGMVGERVELTIDDSRLCLPISLLCFVRCQSTWLLLHLHSLSLLVAMEEIKAVEWPPAVWIFTNNGFLLNMVLLMPSAQDEYITESLTS